MHVKHFPKVEGLNLLSMRLACSSGALLFFRVMNNADGSPECAGFA